MGYYTRHDLEIKTELTDEKLKEIEEYIVEKDLQREINSLEGYQTLNYVENDEGGKSIYLTDEPSKWYSSTEDMKLMSLHFKDILFELNGEGEDPGDIWKAYYLNGKEQYTKAELTFDAFDIKKLK